MDSSSRGPTSCVEVSALVTATSLSLVFSVCFPCCCLTLSFSLLSTSWLLFPAPSYGLYFIWLSFSVRKGEIQVSLIDHYSMQHECVGQSS